MFSLLHQANEVMWWQVIIFKAQVHDPLCTCWSSSWTLFQQDLGCRLQHQNCVHSIVKHVHSAPELMQRTAIIRKNMTLWLLPCTYSEVLVMLPKHVRLILWCRAIPLTDRLTMLPLLYSILDYDRSPASFERYDKMSAWDLFQRSVTAQSGCMHHDATSSCSICF